MKVGAGLAPSFSPPLLSRIEDAGLNAVFGIYSAD